MKGTQGTHPAITTERARRVTITAEEGTLPAHADGETLCAAGERLDVELLARQMGVIVDARADSL
jgi:diacylglycerol kinase family enzyme